MKALRQQSLPLIPLLRAYTDAGIPTLEDLVRLPGLGPRFRAVLAARGELLSERFIDDAAQDDFQAALVRFYEACVPHALHVEALLRRAGIVRHALGHLCRCADPLPRKAERCLAADGPYHVAGLGPAFWSALLQGLEPMAHPAWTPSIVAGLERLRLVRGQPASPGQAYTALLEAHARIRSLEPSLSALHVDHFLTLAAALRGRELGATAAELGQAVAGADVAAVLRDVRARVPLRRRLKQGGAALAAARAQLEAGLAAQNGIQLGAALSALGTPEVLQDAVDWPIDGQALTLWVGRLWEADDPYEILAAFWRVEPVAGAGLWLPLAVLHLRDPDHFHLWDEPSRRALAALGDDADEGGPAVERYRLFNEAVTRLRTEFRIHALEAGDVLAALAQPVGGAASSAGDGRARAAERLPFGGFCADTFRFLEQLGRNNRRAWMEQQRERYRFAVRMPMVELCRALAERYVEPVLRRVYGWDLETAACSGRALTSICKNDYGRSVPYHSELWITFCRRETPAAGGEDAGAERSDASGVARGPAGRPGRRDDVQLFVRLDAFGLSYGLRLGPEVREAGSLFRRNLREHAGLVFRGLRNSGALAECRFSNAGNPDGAVPADPEALVAWAQGKCWTAGKTLAGGTPLLTSEELVGDILLTFDRLLPAYACAVEPDPLPFLTRRAGAPSPTGAYTEGDFFRATFLDGAWLGRARALLDLKRQLVLHGVPGTGKTHVARCLARLLTTGREEAIRLVQFHPAYSYEEFIEGIKARSVEVDGRHDVTYPVEEGLLCAFAAEAARQPAQPHVLIIDEMNRGNLPRVFGELLYLLEYREQTVELPYSRRGFRLPANLYLIGTMNAADRSVALVDQALRRRFSFLEMPPDAAVLAAWLKDQQPMPGLDFAERVVGLFERLNARLRADLGPQCQVGQSYFMLPGLDEARLRTVWTHQVQPLLHEYFAGQPGRAAAYDLEELFAAGQGGSGRGPRRPAKVRG